MALYGKTRFETVIQPVSGKAVPVYEGEILRITQVEGGQCVDFNCFNLHDYKEHMSVGHMRSPNFRKKKGDVVRSNPNRYNPMMAILEMPETCVTDLLGARCEAALFEMRAGFDIHTNCQDTIAECIGEYGLTPDDVHDSFNMWMNSAWTVSGEYFSSAQRNTAREGDSVDLLALMDVLAVPAICGGGDISRSSNYWFKPIKIQIFEPSDVTTRLAQEYFHEYRSKTSKGVESFRIKDVQVERELKPIPGYEPNFINFPLKIQEITIELTDEDYRQIQNLKMWGLGKDDEDAVRSAVLEWHNNNRARK